MTVLGFQIDLGSLIVLVSCLLYAAVTPIFYFTARPWLALMYLGYSIGAVASFAIAMGHR